MSAATFAKGLALVAAFSSLCMMLQMTVLQQLDDEFRRIDASGAVGSYNTTQQQAFSVLGASTPVAAVDQVQVLAALQSCWTVAWVLGLGPLRRKR